MQACPRCGHADSDEGSLSCSACGDWGPLRPIQAALLGLVVLMALALWLLQTPLRGDGPPQGLGLEEITALGTSTAANVLLAGLAGLLLLALGLSLVLGPRMLRALAARLRTPQPPPARPRRATVGHFLLLYLLALFAEVGALSMLPRASLEVDGQSYPLGREGVTFDAQGGDLRRQADGTWVAAPEVAERGLSSVELPTTSGWAKLTWKVGSGRLEHADLHVTSNGHEQDMPLPLSLRPGDELQLAGAAFVVHGPGWTEVVRATGLGKLFALFAVVTALLVLGGREQLTDLGWRRDGWRREALHGAVVLLAFLPVYGLLILGSNLVGTLLGIPTAHHPLIQAMLREGSWPLLLGVALQAVVLAPLLEELLFRGVLMDAGLRAVPRLLALLASSAAFACVHPGFAGLFPLFALALALGGLRLVSPSGSLVGVTVAHALFNAVMLTPLVATLL